MSLVFLAASSLAADTADWPVRIHDALTLLSATNEPCTLAASPRLEKQIAPHRFDIDVSGLDFLWISTNDGGDGYGGDHTCWVDPVLTRPDGSRLDATTLPILFHRTGWENLYVVSPRSRRRHRQLQVAGTVYTNGWWIHPNSTLCLKLDRRFTRFTVGGGTDASAHGGGKVGFSLESHLRPDWLRTVLAESFAREFPEVDRWLATELKTPAEGHKALFTSPLAVCTSTIARLSAPFALDRLAARDTLVFARRTLDLVQRAAPRPALAARLATLEQEERRLAPTADWSAFLARARALRREIIFSHPTLDFSDLLVNQQPPPTYPHQCDQYLGRHNHPGPGLVILRNWKSSSPQPIQLLAGKLPPGSVSHPDLSFDAQRILFAYSDAALPQHLRRFHLWEINTDGTGLRQLTGSPSDPLLGRDNRRTVLIEDFDPCYLPDGNIVFVSTRCQSFGRCHAGRYNPSYMLYLMKSDGSSIRQLSFGEANEWDPSVLPDGRIVYTRWDYINRHDTFYQSLWTIHPDGTGTAHLYGNYTINPCMTAEARAIPDSSRLVATATAHHGSTSGSIILLDPARGEDGPDPLTRFTPDVAFPETEAPSDAGAYQSPWPLCEDLILAAYTTERPGTSLTNAYGIVLIDSLGGREEIFRDPAVSTLCPIPLRPRPLPHILASALPNCPPDTPGRVFIQNVNLASHPFDAPIRALRVNEILGQPTASVPHRGAVRQELPKRVLGTATVAPDGSCAFELPSGRPVQLQALDEHGMAVMTMRSFIYAQPGETLACVGCHEPRSRAPGDLAQKALPIRKLKPLAGQGPGGFSFIRDVQPVLNRHCVSCHGGSKPAADLDLRGTPEMLPCDDYPYFPRETRTCVSYNRLLARPGLVKIAQRNEETGASRPRDYFAAAGRLAPHLLKGHCKPLLADPDALTLLLTWLDLNAPCFGDYSWTRAEFGEPPPPANGTCGLRPCRCGCCWVPAAAQKR